MEEKKTPRAKLHSGGHKTYRTSKGVRHTPHAPHPKPVPLTANQKKFQKSAKESDADYAKRTGLPARKKGEKIENYAARLGVTADRRPKGPGSWNVDYDGRIYKQIASTFGDAADGKLPPKPVRGSRNSKRGGRHTSNKVLDRNLRQATAQYNTFNSVFKKVSQNTAAVAAAKKQEAARVAAAKKATAARVAAANAAAAKQKKEFEAAKKAEAAAFSAAKTQATAPSTPAPSTPQPITPSGGTMAKQTTDTSKGTSGGITESASKAGSVTSLAPEGKAPTELAYTAPDAVVSKVAPALIDTEGTYTAEEDTIKLDSPEDITVEKVVAPTMDALAKQGEVTKITAPEELEAASYDAETLDTEQSVTAAKGTVSDEAIAKADEATLTERAVTAERDTEAEQAAMAEVQDFNISEGSYVDKVTGEKAEVAPAPEIEARQREAILGEPADAGQATQIIDTVGYTASQMRTVKGEAAKGAAAEMIAEVGNIPEELSAIIVENPVEVEAMIDDEPVEVRAAIAALPTEALVSTQMETLLAGMEEGETPMWARPAIAAVERKLAARGMSRSTVGRDALFNSIITSALPMAQSNAEALQKRAAQNLDNEQQANLVRANLESQRRLKNVANRQTAASQTASNAQQMAALQSQFVQDTMIQSAAQQQQVRVENLRNQQQSAVENMRAKQQANMTNLGNEQQMEALNLQMEFDTNKSNMDSENLEKLNEMKIAAEFLAKNAELKQQMDLANLNSDQQMRLANLTHLNNASSENLNAAQKSDLSNLNARLETNLASAQIASQMNIAQLNADQQRAVENAKMVARVDLSKFDAKQQVELANSKFMQTMVQTEFNAEQQTMLQNATAMASMDVANADQRTKLAITNAQAFLQMDMTNLNNEQQANITKAQMNQQRLLSNQSQQNAAKQFNAQSEGQTAQFMASLSNQIQQYNSSSQQAREQFNVVETNKRAAQEAGNKLEVERLNAQLMADVTKFNAQQEFQRDQWNAANAQAIQQSNVAWRRQANLANTAAQNAANGQNVQIAYNMSSQEQTQLWQQLRDDAAYIRQSYENDEQRKSQLVATAISNEEVVKASGGDVGKLLTIANTALKDTKN